MFGTGGKIPMSCIVCNQETEHAAAKRTEWGCDTDLSNDKVLFRIDCIFCDGKDPQCDECGGSNRIPMRRCPNVSVKREHYEIARYASFIDVGILPTDCGYEELPLVFTQALELAMAERKRCRDKQQGGAGG